MINSNDIIFGGGLVIALLLLVRRNSRKQKPAIIPANFSFLREDLSQETILVYEGNELNFSDAIIVTVLDKHFPYYKTLPPERRDIFLSRLKTFITHKTFIIHNKSGFREMPILISATAIKFSMGLKYFLLPHYPHIHIFPAEFIGVYPNIRVLAGNVSGNKIHISWKHFLEGYQFPEDGQNVGLHEMAHAYYYQNFETNEDIDKDFVDKFGIFNITASTILEKENNSTTASYSPIALENFQEFWAESVELFFERSLFFKKDYGELYYTMVNLLNQDPCEDWNL